MRNRFDQLAKQIGREALSPCGVTVVNDEIAPDAQHADLRHQPDPARDAERARIGLLGKLATSPCLIEAFAHAPDPREVRACLSKHLAFWRSEERRSFAIGSEPFLWILAAGRPVAALAGLGAARARGWPRGVYLGPSILRVGVVVASELPRTRETLLARLMAGGRLLPSAIEELAALPDDAHECRVASRPLLDFRDAVAQELRKTVADREVLVIMEDAFKELRARARDQGRKEGLEEGLEQGELAGLRRALFRVLGRRKLTPTRSEAALIEACVDARRLERWLDRAQTVDTVAKALGPAATPRARRGRARQTEH
jgi:hypothetical protein